jgi:hypothetical protein
LKSHLPRSCLAALPLWLWTSPLAAGEALGVEAGYWESAETYPVEISFLTPATAGDPGGGDGGGGPTDPEPQHSEGDDTPRSQDNDAICTSGVVEKPDGTCRASLSFCVDSETGRVVDSQVTYEGGACEAGEGGEITAFQYCPNDGTPCVVFPAPANPNDDPGGGPCSGGFCFFLDPRLILEAAKALGRLFELLFGGYGVGTPSAWGAPPVGEEIEFANRPLRPTRRDPQAGTEAPTGLPPAATEAPPSPPPPSSPPAGPPSTPTPRGSSVLHQQDAADNLLMAPASAPSTLPYWAQPTWSTCTAGGLAAAQSFVTGRASSASDYFLALSGTAATWAVLAAPVGRHSQPLGRVAGSYFGARAGYFLMLGVRRAAFVGSVTGSRLGVAVTKGAAVVFVAGASYAVGTGIYCALPSYSPEGWR